MATKVGSGKGDKFLMSSKGSVKDQLFGQGGNDKLAGGGGNDVVVGGTGSDSLSGGKGADTFVFGKGDFGKKAAVDTITDFKLKDGDILQIAKGLAGIKTVKQLLEKADSANHGKDTVINLGGGNKIVLKDVKLDDFKKHPGDHIDISG